MAIARSILVDQVELGLHHCMTRCARGALLGGADPETGGSLDHRKAWLRERLIEVSQSFAIDVWAFSVSGDRYDLVLQTRPDVARTWSTATVAERWLMLCPPRGSVLIDSAAAGAPSASYQRALANLTRDAERLELYRARLADLSWFVRFVNEAVARRANREENVTGRFWQGRFRSQALLDSGAILSSMASVDLRPLREETDRGLWDAGLTSVQERLARLHHQSEASVVRVMAMAIQPVLGPAGDRGLPEPFAQLSLRDYVELLEWTGSQLNNTVEAEAMPAQLERLVSEFGLNPERWVSTVGRFGDRFRLAVGSEGSLMRRANQLGKRWLHGRDEARQVYRREQSGA